MERPFNTRAPIAERPAYKANEAATVLGLPASTVKAWCFGQGYTTEKGAHRTIKAVIAPADSAGRYLSFVNLCELHVLAVIRRHHRLKLQDIRNSLDYVRKQLGEARPLISQQFLTNGVDLFIERAAQLINVTQQGQTALRGDFAEALARIERDRKGGVVRLFPYSRPAHTADQPRVVAVDPQLAFGRPVLVKAAVPTDVIRERFMAGDSSREMAEDYGVPVDDIDEALRFANRLAA